MSPAKKFEILVANGVNLDLLGQREPEIYGSRTLADLDDWVKQAVPMLEQAFYCRLQVVSFQSNSEHEFLTELSSKAWDGMIINPAAWTHTSLAIADRLAALDVPYIEVHISSLAAREDYRKQSYTAARAMGVISGLGFGSYTAALYAMTEYLVQSAN